LGLGLAGAYAYPYGYGYAAYPYGGYGYAAYPYGGYDDGGCYLTRQRVWTSYGWRIRRVEVCN
jgi:hypothetical protein